MEAVYQEQKQLINKLSDLIRNYNADGKDRKKELSYYPKKLQQIEEYWLKFDENDSLIRREHEDITHEYYAEECYERAKEIFEKQCEKIRGDETELKNKIEAKRVAKELRDMEKMKKKDTEHVINAASSSVGKTNEKVISELEKLEDLQKSGKSIDFNLSDDDENLSSTDDNDDDSNNEMNNDQNLPETVKMYFFMWNELRNAINNAKKMNIYESQGSAGAQLDNLKMIWNEFRFAHRGISVGENKMHCKKIDALQSQYLKLIGKLNDMVHGNSNRQSIQLPKIKLPEFDGERANWRSFKDLFDKIVHNNQSISDAIKMQYLKSNLTDKAAKLVEHLPPTENSYKTCYELLNNRYENERENVTSLIDAILDLEIQKNETSIGLKTIHDKTFECIMSIESIGTSVKNWDVLLIQILMRKLNKKTILDYESKLMNVKKNQTLTYFLKYLENRFLALMSAETKTKGNFKYNNEKSNEKGYEKSNEKNQHKEMGFRCTYCNGAHSIYKCENFEKIDSVKRFEWVKENKLCFVCLLKHGRNECKSKYDCKKCNKKHNVLIHIEKKTETKSLIATTSEQSENVNEANVNILIGTRDQDNLLATAMVRVKTKNGDMIMARAVIDMGSQSALVTENTRQALGLNAEKICAGVDGISAITATANRRVELEICSRFSNEIVLTTRALVMKKITNLKVFKDDLAKYDHLQNLAYADPTVNSDHPIDILLNVADYAKILKTGLIKGTPNEPVAQNTELGWIIFGSDGAKNPMNEQNCIELTTLISNVEINKKISGFFEMPEIEDDSDAETEMTEEEKFCEKYFLDTTKRDESGRFIVSMPFRNNREPELGESKKTALAIFFQLENKFKMNPKLKEQYTEAINEAIASGHLKKVKQPVKNPHYIPHHAVFKDSTTTKLRTVYNASKCTANGKSLNEQLLVGRMTQPTMFELALRWRSFKIAVVADIEKMYKQIRLDENQQHLQIILWRDDTGGIQEYQMTTVTFGIANSPYLAIRWLKAVADAVENEYPMASSAIRSNFYVDDHTGGTCNMEQAKELYNQLKNAFRSVGCNLRKFVSNSQELMNYIDENDKETIISNPTKVLGILWDPILDTLKFKLNLNINLTPKTKRELVAEISTIYDPLGLISPVVVKAKILLQHVWAKSNKIGKNGWDDTVPKEFIDEWMRIKSRSSAVNSLSIKRFLQTKENSNVQLHGYCDASEKAYAACIYIRARNGKNISSTLLVAKSKNAPTQTIPKLELCGAKLLVQLVKKVRKTLKIDIDQVHLWCDSTCVLGWIGANPLRYKKYVASRVIYIQKLKDVSWHHVAGNLNPADCASRGLYGDELKHNKLWWNGPPNLLTDTDYNEKLCAKYTNENELKSVNGNVLMATNTGRFIPQSESFYKLKKTIALVLRFVHNCKSKNVKKMGPITVREMRLATTTIMKTIQSEEFDDEIKCLKKGKNLNSKSKLFRLNVFFDDDMLLRVGGRLKNACVPFETKHQILVPKKHSVTSLLINEYHKVALHGGPKLMESLIRQKYWIIDSQSTIKNEIKGCFQCAKNAPRAIDQLMAHLPKYRVNKPFKVFLNTAIDYAGPFVTKTSTLRNSKSEKSYVAVFICMATRAIHLELVCNLTADAFIAALRRFVGRRGKIENIFSDNGTNFTAANKILQELTKNEINRFQKLVDEEFLANGIEWHFTPPGSPHHNGLAEAAVKSMKFHLRRVVGERCLTFEEMATLLVQIEAVVNSRPICTTSTDPNDCQPITPAHFLNMAPMELLPDDDFNDIKSNYLNRWQMIQKLFQNFWWQWKSQYVNQLQVRNKWCTTKPEININDLVMIKEDSLPATKWMLGRVIEKHPGDDGKTRVVTVKTAKNVIKRTITKIAPMPIKMGDNNSKNDGGTKKNGVSLAAVLISLLAMINTTKAHELTIFNTDQNMENKHNISISVKNSNNFALILVLGIFCIIFFLFLIFIMRILYKGSTSVTKSIHEATNNIQLNKVPVETPAQKMVSSYNQQEHTPLDATKRFDTYEQSPYIHQSTFNNDTQLQTYYTKHYTPAPIPAERTQSNETLPYAHNTTSRITMQGETMSPIVKLEKDFYEARQASCTTAIYPITNLRSLQNELGTFNVMK